MLSSKLEEQRHLSAVHLFVAFEEPRVRRGFVIKARPSAVLWQVKYGCHPDDKSNISPSRQNVNSSPLPSSTTTLSRPLLRPPLRTEKEENGDEPFRSINVTRGRKNFNFLLTLYVLIAARSCLGIF